MNRYGPSEVCIWCGREKAYGEPCPCNQDEINRLEEQQEEERREVKEN